MNQQLKYMMIMKIILKIFMLLIQDIIVGVFIKTKQRKNI